ncbi:hypothetical protein TWF696_005114 [Orbilia brochopaga]|uniref:Uncharacterized protein n=1 Tax=Orbilia brochopaga TaxID=3140254 RepID=A0AAV9V300_9PEZI
MHPYVTLEPAASELQSPLLTVEQAAALHAAMAAGRVRDRKSPPGLHAGEMIGESLFKPGYQVGGSGSGASRGNVDASPRR